MFGDKILICKSSTQYRIVLMFCNSAYDRKCEFVVVFQELDYFDYVHWLKLKTFTRWTLWYQTLDRMNFRRCLRKCLNFVLCTIHSKDLEWIFLISFLVSIPGEFFYIIKKKTTYRKLIFIISFSLGFEIYRLLFKALWKIYI